MSNSARNRRKPNATGRLAGGIKRFVQLPHDVIYSQAFSALSPLARSILIEVAAQFNGSNNGTLFLGTRDAAARAGIADKKASAKALDDLVALGFLQMTKDASFKQKASDKVRARCWAITWQAVPALRQSASHAYLKRLPEPKTPEWQRMERRAKSLKAYQRAASQGKVAGVDSSPMAYLEADTRSHAGVDSFPEKSVIGKNPPMWSGPKSTPHIDVTMGYGGTEWMDRARWWQGKVLADLDAFRRRREAELAVAA